MAVVVRWTLTVIIMTNSRVEWVVALVSTPRPYFINTVVFHYLYYSYHDPSLASTSYTQSISLEFSLSPFFFLQFSLSVCLSFGKIFVYRSVCLLISLFSLVLSQSMFPFSNCIPLSLFILTIVFCLSVCLPTYHSLFWPICQSISLTFLLASIPFPN